MASRVFLACSWVFLVVLAWVANLWPNELPSEPHARATLLADNGFTWQLPYGPQMPTSGPVDAGHLYSWIDRDAKQGSLSTPLRRRLNTLGSDPRTAVEAKIARSYALCQVEDQPLKAFRELAPLPSKLPMVMSTRALALAKLGREEEALKVWRQAMKGSLTRRERNLCADFLAEHRYLEDLKQLDGGSDSTRRVKLWLATYSGSLLESLKLELLEHRENSYWSWLACLLIAAVWIGILRGRSLCLRVWGYLAGVISALLVHRALDALMWKLHLVEIRTSQSLGFWRYFFEAGILEEASKLAPLLFWWWMGQLRQTKDWVLFGCLSALGFATFENLGYYNWSLNSLVARFVFCVAGHMALTGSVGYVLARSARRWRTVLGLTAFLTAALCHAIYNYSDSAKPLIAMLQTMGLLWLLRGRLRVDSLAWLGGGAVLLQAFSFWQIHAAVATDIANATLLVNARFLVVLPAFLCFLKPPRHWTVEQWMIFFSVACFSTPHLLGQDPFLGYFICFFFIVPMGVSARNFNLWSDLPTHPPACDDLERSGFRPVSVTAQGSVAQHRHSRRIGWLRWALAMTLAQMIWLPLMVGRASAEEFCWAYCPALGLMLGLNFCLIWPATLLSPSLIGAWSHPGGTSLLAFRGLGGRPRLIAYSCSPTLYLATANAGLQWLLMPLSLPGTWILRWCRSFNALDVVNEHQQFLATLEDGIVRPEGHDPEIYLTMVRTRSRNGWSTFGQQLLAPFRSPAPEPDGGNAQKG